MLCFIINHFIKRDKIPFKCTNDEINRIKSMSATSFNAALDNRKYSALVIFWNCPDTFILINLNKIEISIYKWYNSYTFPKLLAIKTESAWIPNIIIHAFLLSKFKCFAVKMKKLNFFWKNARNWSLQVGLSMRKL